MNKLFLIAILSVGIISGAVFSPEIWAIVEPHITITMESGQTTKPFVINDDASTEVFSVDVDGIIFPVQQVQFTEQFLYSQPDVTVIPLGTLEANPVVVFKIQLTKTVDVDQIDQEPYVLEMVANGQFQRTEGTGSVRFQFEESSDDISYTNAFTMGSSNTSWNDANFNSFGQFGGVDVKYYRGIFYNTNADTVGEWKYFQIYLDLLVPNGYTVERII